MNETPQTKSETLPARQAISIEELRVMSDATVRLIEIRARGCPHLSVENVAPELLHKLLTRLQLYKDGYSVTSEFVDLK